jgi:hypothetical protein
VIGLFLYLCWLRGIWRESSLLITSATKLKKRGAKVFLPVEMQTLLVAFMVSLLAGEILYPYRPSFTCMGMFLFLCAVLNHPALVWGDAARPRLKTRVRFYRLNKSSTVEELVCQNP